MNFKFTRQFDAMDCGPASLQMIAKYYGKNYPLSYLRELCYLNRNGVTMLGISDAAESIGFRTLGAKITKQKFFSKMVFPCIVHWRKTHYIVVYKSDVKTVNGELKGNVYVADPSFGKIKYSVSEFLEGWVTSRERLQEIGLVLVLSPTNLFFEDDDNTNIEKRTTWDKLKYYFPYFKEHRKLYIQIIWGFIIGMIIQILLPFLSQTLIDSGVQNRDINLIYLILIAQLVLSITQLISSFFQSWIGLEIGTRISIALRADFILKLLKMPVKFFETKTSGDLMQRMGDHTRIQNFIGQSSLGMLMSFTSFFVFSIILLYYNSFIFLLFILGHTLFVLWTTVFLRIRRLIDYKNFDKNVRNRNTILQLIEGAQEIKLLNIERKHRWKWEKIQSDIFKINIKGLKYSQIQSSGSFLINRATNIIITVIAAKSVIDGEMTLGMMLSLSYIIGQLKAPINNLVGYINSFQDTKIGLERLGEVQFEQDETAENMNKISDLDLRYKNIELKNVTFSYLGSNVPPALNSVSIKIPSNKVTAIVGTSGSGKSTLLKLLMGFYKPDDGHIYINDNNLQNINSSFWRSKFGAVTQEGILFSDTIAENIAATEEEIDKHRLILAAQHANVAEFINTLPAGYNTVIGRDGNGLSAGQKQRLLLARIFYRNPEFIFLDEATNSLDAENERMIVENLEHFFKDKTVVVVAHRLSTVKNADQIVVLDNGAVAEIGTHNELVNLRGRYFNLVKNQLELPD